MRHDSERVTWNQGSAAAFDCSTFSVVGNWGPTVADSEFQVVSPADRSKPMSILSVEDEALVASVIEEVLVESGFRVAGIAASGPEALSLAAENQPALALVDIRLTGPIDGIELACLLRQKH